MYLPLAGVGAGREAGGCNGVNLLPPVSRIPMIQAQLGRSSVTAQHLGNSEGSVPIWSTWISEIIRLAHDEPLDPHYIETRQHVTDQKGEHT
jgi:hypothetical protein